MSITSNYHMATSLTPDGVYALLRDNLDFVTRERRSEKFGNMLLTSNDGLQIETYPPMSSGGIEETFGFRPAVRVALHLARASEPGYYEGEANTVRTVNWLINNVAGDAVLLHNLDLPVLLRKGDKIWLDRKDRFWRPEDLALLTFPYEWKTLPKY